MQNNFIFLNVGEIRPYVLPSNSADTQVIPLSHRARVRVSLAPIGTSRARGNRRHTGRQEFLILHTRSRNAPITDPGWVYKVLHIRQTYSTSRVRLSPSSRCLPRLLQTVTCRPSLPFLSFSFNLALFRFPLLLLPFPFSLLCCFSRSLTISILVRSTRILFSPGFHRLRSFRSSFSGGKVTSITIFFYRKIKIFCRSRQVFASIDARTRTPSFKTT